MKFKFTVVEAERREAKPGHSGKCPVCGDAMIAKCGQLRIWHWSHRVTRKCDRWWEIETEWHRDWKNQFPEAWQEIRHQAKDGERHIADVKTESGIVLEFQNSHLRGDERESRENFYEKMVWVVNGRRLKRDRARLFASLDAGIVVNREPPIVSVLWKEGALLRDWVPSRAPVYFDFGDSEPGDTTRFDGPLCGDLTRVARTARRIYRQCQEPCSCTPTLKDCLSRTCAQRPLRVLRSTSCTASPSVAETSRFRAIPS